MQIEQSHICPVIHVSEAEIAEGGGMARGLYACEIHVENADGKIAKFTVELRLNTQGRPRATLTGHKKHAATCVETVSDFQRHWRK